MSQLNGLGLLSKICVFMFFWCFGVNPLLAHEQRPAIVTFNVQEDSEFLLEVSTNVEALIAKIGPEHDDTSTSPNAARYERLRQLEPAELKSQLHSFLPDLLRGVELIFDDTPAELHVKGVRIPEVGDVELARVSSIFLKGTVPDGASGIQWRYSENFGASILRVIRPGADLESQFVIAGGKSEIFNIESPGSRNSWQLFVDYVKIGFVHIIPEGLDHILFVLGLFLLSAKWRPLLAQVTLFTLAHSVTLGLGLYGLVQLSPKIVEPLIALSIVYVAVENVMTDKLRAWRSLLVFAFGLLHGLGFAGILLEIGMEPSQFAMGLIAFNIGVELGQLSVIAIALICVWKFVNAPWYRRKISIPASVAIGLIGMWWFIERTVF